MNALEKQMLIDENNWLRAEIKRLRKENVGVSVHCAELIEVLTDIVDAKPGSLGEVAALTAACKVLRRGQQPKAQNASK